MIVAVKGKLKTISLENLRHNFKIRETKKNRNILLPVVCGEMPRTAGGRGAREDAQ